MAAARKIALSVTCLAALSAAAIFWQVHSSNVAERKLAEAARSIRARAEQGDPKSQYEVGLSYAHGRGVPQDHAQAVLWYRKAADQGYAKAQYALSFMYHNAQGVPRDDAEAARWSVQAAQQEDANAQYSLGVSYAQGQGVPTDYAQAAGWFRKAAVQGNASAQYSLGLLYRNGQGVPRDDAEADRWFDKAAAQGDASAQLAVARGSKRAVVAFVVKRELFSPAGIASLVAVLLGLPVVLVPQRRWKRAKWLPSALLSAGCAAAAARPMLPSGFSAVSLSSPGRLVWIALFAGVSTLYATAAVIQAVRESKPGSPTPPH